MALRSGCRDVLEFWGLPIVAGGREMLPINPVFTLHVSHCCDVLCEGEQLQAWLGRFWVLWMHADDDQSSCAWVRKSPRTGLASSRCPRFEGQLMI